jgi:L-fuculose-phosphate aldolase
MSRKAIIRTSVEMVRLGLTRGSSGNVSERTDNGFLVTPSGMEPRTLELEDIVHVDMAGTPTGRCKPSSEWRFHRDLYAARPDIGAIVHSHSPFVIALASHGRGIPAFHYMVAMAGGSDIRCAPYATYGSQELSDHAVTAMLGRTACLLAHHGMIAAGKTLERALALAVEVESLAEGFWRALQLGDPAILCEAEMAVVIEKFKSYGANAHGGEAS